MPTNRVEELLPEDALCSRCGCYKFAHGEDLRCEPVGWTFQAPMNGTVEGLVERLRELFATASEPYPAPLPEQDSRAAEAMAGVADQRARTQWAGRIAGAQREIVLLVPSLLDAILSLQSQLVASREALERAAENFDRLAVPHMVDPDVVAFAMKAAEQIRAALTIGEG